MKATRALFLGNHTVGVRTLAALTRCCDVVGVVAHPEDPEDGVVYESVAARAAELGLAWIRAKGRDAELAAFVRARQPDLLWCTDYRYLLPPELVAVAPLGAVNLHPSLLPKYRGRAPINWAILEGERRLGLTAHVVEDGVDSGDIIEQMAFDLGPDEDVADALEHLYPRYETITERVCAHLAAGTVPRTPQPAGEWPVWQRRGPEDGRIDWNDDAARIVNLVRAVAPPYPGAFTERDGRRCWVHRAGWTSSGGGGQPPGTVVALDPVTVVAGTGAVTLLRHLADDGAPSPALGDRFDV